MPRTWFGRVNRFRRCHGFPEPIAPLRDGLDVSIRLAVVAKRLPYKRHRVGEVRLLDERSRPHVPEQVLLRHEMSGVSDERHEQVVGLRRQRNRLAVPEEQPLRRLEPERSEVI